MIKPEILEMVEESKDPKRSCWDCPHKELCDEFGKLIKGESVSQTVKKGIDKLVSFLTSQEVCEWEEVGNPEDIQYHYKTSCGHTDYKLHHPLNCLVKFCLFCGGKIIKKGE